MCIYKLEIENESMAGEVALLFEVLENFNLFPVSFFEIFPRNMLKSLMIFEKKKTRKLEIALKIMRNFQNCMEF